MPHRALFAYVEGYDLDDIADALEGRLRAFVEGTGWVAGEVWVVNQKWEDDTSCTQPEDNPCRWDLGLNLHLPDRGVEPAEWFADVEAIAPFLSSLDGEFGVNFVIGIADARTELPRTSIGLTIAVIRYRPWL
jgi:hypothetical protein